MTDTERAEAQPALPYECNRVTNVRLWKEYGDPDRELLKSAADAASDLAYMGETEGKLYWVQLPELSENNYWWENEPTEYQEEHATIVVRYEVTGVVRKVREVT